MKKNLIIGILLASITLASCKKEGCTDELASNYDDKAKKEDDSCDYYDETKASIKSTYADIAYA